MITKPLNVLTLMTLVASLVGVVGQPMSAHARPAGDAPTEQLQAEDSSEAETTALVSLVESDEVIAPPAAPQPLPEPFSPVLTGIVNLAAEAETPVIGIGQLRPQNLEGLSETNADWLQSVILPLYASPGGPHWGWLYQGWLIPDGQAYLAIGRDAGFAMVEAYDNLYTFPVLEVQEDGWFRVQYTTNGSAWAHVSQLELGDIHLTLEGWEEQLASQPSVFFVEPGRAQPLRSHPEQANNMLSLVAADSLIEPLAFEGDWMRVRVTRPAAACTPLTGATVTEGWMRWRDNESAESLVWYSPDGQCQASR